MAARLDAQTDSLYRTSDVLDYNSPFTFMGWIKLSSDRNTIGMLLSINNGSPTGTNDGLGVDSNGTTLRIDYVVSGSPDYATGSDLTVGQWYHVALVRESNTVLKGYLDGALDITNTHSDLSGRAACSRMELMGQAGSIRWGNGVIYAVKAWATALTPEEIAAEMQTVRPARMENLYGWWPELAGERTADYSGYGRDWSESGTLADEDGPPVSWGGAHLLAGGAVSGQTISGAGAITTGEAFGEPTVTLGLAVISPSSIGSGEAFGEPTVTPGPVAVSEAGDIASAEAFEEPQVNLSISPSSIESEEAFEDPSVLPGPVTISDAGDISSGEAFGSPVAAGPVTVTEGIPSAEAFGTPRVSITPLVSFISKPYVIYENWLDDYYGNRFELLDNILSLSVTKAENDIGAWEIELPGDFDASQLQTDYMIEIMRSPVGGTLKWLMVGFIRRIAYVTNEDGEDAILIAGPDPNVLLEGSIIDYEAGTSQAEKTAPADDMMKAIIRENMGSLCTDPERDLSWLNFSVAANTSSAPTITMSMAWENVLDALREIAEASRQEGTPLYFDVVPVLVGSNDIGFEFRTYVNQRGQDHSYESGTPVVFGPGWGNVSSPRLDFESSGEYNVITVGGHREKSHRRVRRVKHGRRFRSPWARREKFRRAWHAPDTDAGLDYEGQAELQWVRPKNKFTATLLDVEQSRFQIDWDHGDKVAVEDHGFSGDGYVRALHVSVTPSQGEVIRGKIEVET